MSLFELVPCGPLEVAQAATSTSPHTRAQTIVEHLSRALHQLRAQPDVNVEAIRSLLYRSRPDGPTTDGIQPRAVDLLALAAAQTMLAFLQDTPALQAKTDPLPTEESSNVRAVFWRLYPVWQGEVVHQHTRHLHWLRQYSDAYDTVHVAAAADNSSDAAAPSNMRSSLEFILSSKGVLGPGTDAPPAPAPSSLQMVFDQLVRDPIPGESNAADSDSGLLTQIASVFSSQAAGWRPVSRSFEQATDGGHSTSLCCLAALSTCIGAPQMIAALRDMPPSYSALILSCSVKNVPAALPNALGVAAVSKRMGCSSTVNLYCGECTLTTAQPLANFPCCWSLSVVALSAAKDSQNPSAARRVSLAGLRPPLFGFSAEGDAPNQPAIVFDAATALPAAAIWDALELKGDFWVPSPTTNDPLARLLSATALPPSPSATTRGCVVLPLTTTLTIELELVAHSRSSVQRPKAVRGGITFEGPVLVALLRVAFPWLAWRLATAMEQTKVAPSANTASATSPHVVSASACFTLGGGYTLSMPARVAGDEEAAGLSSMFPDTLPLGISGRALRRAHIGGGERLERFNRTDPDQGVLECTLALGADALLWVPPCSSGDGKDSRVADVVFSVSAANAAPFRTSVLLPLTQPTEQAEGPLWTWPLHVNTRLVVQSGLSRSVALCLGLTTVHTATGRMSTQVAVATLSPFDLVEQGAAWVPLVASGGQTVALLRLSWSATFYNVLAGLSRRAIAPPSGHSGLKLMVVEGRHLSAFTESRAMLGKAQSAVCHLQLLPLHLNRTGGYRTHPASGEAPRWATTFMLSLEHMEVWGLVLSILDGGCTAEQQARGEGLLGVLPLHADTAFWNTPCGEAWLPLLPSFGGDWSSIPNADAAAPPESRALTVGGRPDGAPKNDASVPLVLIRWSFVLTAEESAAVGTAPLVITTGHVEAFTGSPSTDTDRLPPPPAALDRFAAPSAAANANTVAIEAKSVCGSPSTLWMKNGRLKNVSSLLLQIPPPASMLAAVVEPVALATVGDLAKIDSGEIFATTETFSKRSSENRTPTVDGSPHHSFSETRQRLCVIASLCHNGMCNSVILFDQATADEPSPARGRESVGGPSGLQTSRSLTFSLPTAEGMRPRGFNNTHLAVCRDKHRNTLLTEGLALRNCGPADTLFIMIYRTVENTGAPPSAPVLVATGKESIETLCAVSTRRRSVLGDGAASSGPQEFSANMTIKLLGETVAGGPALLLPSSAASTGGGGLTTGGSHPVFQMTFCLKPEESAAGPSNVGVPLAGLTDVALQLLAANDTSKRSSPTVESSPLRSLRDWREHKRVQEKSLAQAQTSAQWRPAHAYPTTFSIALHQLHLATALAAAGVGEEMVLRVWMLTPRALQCSSHPICAASPMGPAPWATQDEGEHADDHPHAIPCLEHVLTVREGDVFLAPPVTATATVSFAAPAATAPAPVLAVTIGTRQRGAVAVRKGPAAQSTRVIPSAAAKAVPPTPAPTTPTPAVDAAAGTTPVPVGFGAAARRRAQRAAKGGAADNAEPPTAAASPPPAPTPPQTVEVVPSPTETGVNDAAVVSLPPETLIAAGRFAFTEASPTTAGEPVPVPLRFGDTFVGTVSVRIAHNMTVCAGVQGNQAAAGTVAIAAEVMRVKLLNEQVATSLSICGDAGAVTYRRPRFRLALSCSADAHRHLHTASRDLPTIGGREEPVHQGCTFYCEPSALSDHHHVSFQAVCTGHDDQGKRPAPPVVLRQMAPVSLRHLLQTAGPPRRRTTEPGESGATPTHANTVFFDGSIWVPLVIAGQGLGSSSFSGPVLSVLVSFRISIAQPTTDQPATSLALVLPVASSQRSIALPQLANTALTLQSPVKFTGEEPVQHLSLTDGRAFVCDDTLDALPPSCHVARSPNVLVITVEHIWCTSATALANPEPVALYCSVLGETGSEGGRVCSAVTHDTRRAVWAERFVCDFGGALQVAEWSSLPWDRSVRLSLRHVGATGASSPRQEAVGTARLDLGAIVASLSATNTSATPPCQTAVLVNSSGASIGELVFRVGVRETCFRQCISMCQPTLRLGAIYQCPDALLRKVQSVTVKDVDPIVLRVSLTVYHCSGRVQTLADSIHPLTAALFSDTHGRTQPRGAANDSDSIRVVSPNPSTVDVPMMEMGSTMLVECVVEGVPGMMRSHTVFNTLDQRWEGLVPLRMAEGTNNSQLNTSIVVTFASNMTEAVPPALTPAQEGAVALANSSTILVERIVEHSFDSRRVAQPVIVFEDVDASAKEPLLECRPIAKHSGWIMKVLPTRRLWKVSLYSELATTVEPTPSRVLVGTGHIDGCAASRHIPLYNGNIRVPSVLAVSHRPADAGWEGGPGMGLRVSVTVDTADGSGFCLETGTGQTAPCTVRSITAAFVQAAESNTPRRNVDGAADGPHTTTITKSIRQWSPTSADQPFVCVIAAHRLPSVTLRLEVTTAEKRTPFEFLIPLEAVPGINVRHDAPSAGLADGARLVASVRLQLTPHPLMDVTDGTLRSGPLSSLRCPELEALCQHAAPMQAHTLSLQRAAAAYATVEAAFGASLSDEALPAATPRDAAAAASTRGGTASAHWLLPMRVDGAPFAPKHMDIHYVIDIAVHSEAPFRCSTSFVSPSSIDGMGAPIRVDTSRALFESLAASEKIVLTLWEQNAVDDKKLRFFGSGVMTLGACLEGGVLSCTVVLSARSTSPDRERDLKHIASLRDSADKSGGALSPKEKSSPSVFGVLTLLLFPRAARGRVLLAPRPLSRVPRHDVLCMTLIPATIAVEYPKTRALIESMSLQLTAPGVFMVATCGEAFAIRKLTGTRAGSLQCPPLTIGPYLFSKGSAPMQLTVMIVDVVRRVVLAEGCIETPQSATGRECSRVVTLRGNCFGEEGGAALGVSGLVLRAAFDTITAASGPPVSGEESHVDVQAHVSPSPRPPQSSRLSAHSSRRSLLDMRKSSMAYVPVARTAGGCWRGTLLVVGGRSSTGLLHQDAWLCRTEGTGFAVQQLVVLTGHRRPPPMAHHTVTIIGDEAYVVGGFGCAVGALDVRMPSVAGTYEGVEGTFTVGAPADKKAVAGTAPNRSRFERFPHEVNQALPTGTPKKASVGYLNSVWILNLVDGCWRTLPPPAAQEASRSVAPDPDDTQPAAVAELLLSQAAPLSDGVDYRADHAACAVGAVVLIHGGLRVDYVVETSLGPGSRKAQHVVMPTVRRRSDTVAIDTATGRHFAMPASGPALSHHAAASLNSVAYIFGGVDPEGHYSGDLHCLQTSTPNARADWVTIHPATQQRPSARCGHAMAATHKKLFVFGGVSAATGVAPLDVLWSFSPREAIWSLLDCSTSPRWGCVFGGLGMINEPLLAVAGGEPTNAVEYVHS